MATAPKNLRTRKARETASADKLGQKLNTLVEKKFLQMSPADRERKHKEFISALKGRKP